MTAEEVLVYTRLAADKVGATKMDRPEDVERNPRHRRRLRRADQQHRPGTRPQVDEANPRPANKHGHILEITERRNDAGATTFAWSLPLVCGDPADPSTYFAGFDKTKVSPISCPDNVAFDARRQPLDLHRRQRSSAPTTACSPCRCAAPSAGHLKQFLTVPVGAETCGPLISSDQRSVFVAVQHPGEIHRRHPRGPHQPLARRRHQPAPPVRRRRLAQAGQEDRLLIPAPARVLL